MNQIILDMPSMTAQALEVQPAPQGLFESLMARLTASNDRAETIGELEERADAYQDSQPSYAADLRAAIARAHAA